MRLMDRFRQFMIGRYGNDDLNMALLVLYVIASLLFAFLHWSILLLLCYVGIFIIFFRMFSKNTRKRYQENQKFLKTFGPLVGRFKGMGKGKNGYNPYQTYQKPKKEKDHKVFQCGKCGQKIRVPKGKGKIVITCPKCKQEFIKRT